MRERLRRELGGIEPEHTKELTPVEEEHAAQHKPSRNQQSHTIDPHSTGTAFHSAKKELGGAGQHRRNGSVTVEKPSAVFLTAKRKELDEDERRCKKEYSDPNYNVKYSAIKAKP